MANYLEGQELRQLLFGRKVEKASTLFVQNAAANLFTVAGGRVLITSLVGEVTVVIGANAISFNVRYTKTAGSAVALCAATVCTSDAVGTLYGITGVAADLMSAQTTTGTEVPNVTFLNLMKNALLLPTGTMDVLATNADPDGGAASWALTYIPYDDGASVVAA